MGLSGLSTLLMRERELLELLAFKLDEERLLVEAGRSRWLGHACREVEVVLDKIAEVELARAVEVASVTPDLDLGHDVTLATLAAAAPPPWSAVFQDHLGALRALAREVLALAGLTQGVLAHAEAGPVPGGAGLAGAGGDPVDARAVQAAITGNEGVLRPSVVDFVLG